MRFPPGDNRPAMDDEGGGTPEADGERPLLSSVLVLNQHYMAVRVVSARRAFALLFKNSAEAVDAEDGHFGTFNFAAWLERSRLRYDAPVDHEQFVRTPRFSILVPRVIRLISYDKTPRREIKFNRRNILARDENRCQYCGRRVPASQLSIDHVTPKSRGGISTWTNVVAACNDCNTRKGGRLPSEAGMRLVRPPAVPRRNPALADKIRHRKYQIWRHFLGQGEMGIDS